MAEVVSKLWATLVVIKVSFKKFIDFKKLPPGFDVESIKTGDQPFELWAQMNVQGATSVVLQATFKDPISGQQGTFDINTRTTGLPDIKGADGASPWSDFVVAIRKAGIEIPIHNVQGFFMDGKFKCSDGTLLEMGYQIKKWVDQTKMSIDWESGKQDTFKYTDKFGFMKGVEKLVPELNNKTYTGLFTPCSVWISNRHEKRQRGGSAGGEAML